MRIITPLVFVALMALGVPDPTAARRAVGQGPDTVGERHFAVPISLLEEHAELYSAFEGASRLPGETGAAARRVVALRGPHVAKEQRIAYPLLRLLPMLSVSEPEPWMTDLLPLSDQLRAALPTLKQEHVLILEVLAVFKYAALKEGYPQHAFLAERVRHHIKFEEEILYPAALVTADCVRDRLDRPLSRR
jgi:hypothetical protein